MLIICLIFTFLLPLVTTIWLVRYHYIGFVVALVINTAMFLVVVVCLVLEIIKYKKEKSDRAELKQEE